jgi:hypothetical protein
MHLQGQKTIASGHFPLLWNLCEMWMLEVFEF